MKYRTRINYSESQKALMWDRWRRVESLQQIAQLFDRNHSSVQSVTPRQADISKVERLAGWLRYSMGVMPLSASCSRCSL